MGGGVVVRRRLLVRWAALALCVASCLELRARGFVVTSPLRQQQRQEQQERISADRMLIVNLVESRGRSNSSVSNVQCQAPPR